MNNEENIKRLFDKNELRRLEKASKEKDKRKLMEWGLQFEDTIRQEYEKDFDETVQKELLSSIDKFITAIIYTLHFNEKCKFGGKRIDDFMGDLLATIDGFTDGSYNPEEYKEILKEDGIDVKTRQK